jgi:hypothetical protein
LDGGFWLTTDILVAGRSNAAVIFGLAAQICIQGLRALGDSTREPAIWFRFRGQQINSQLLQHVEEFLVRGFADKARHW